MADASEAPPKPLAPRSSGPFRRLRPFGVGSIAVLAVCGALVFPAMTLAWFWFSPSGIGERRASPDERYEASVYKMRRGTATGGIDRYIEFKVVERRPGREIWHVVQRYAPDVDPPHYEARGIRFVEWAPDSKSVSVPVAGGRTMTFDVP